jgi:hypothetical protein
MRKSYADMLREEGVVQSLQEILLRLLRLKFGVLTFDVAAVVQNCADVEQLDGWLDNVVTAESLEEVEIGSVSWPTPRVVRLQAGA